MATAKARSVTGKRPPISVVMPVHNKVRFIDAAVESILRQSFGDFEFVILDDGSTDGSLEKLKGWAAKDGRIRLITGESCSGPVESSNRIVQEARAPLIARMDGDDVSRLDRLQRQKEIMDKSPAAVLIGSICDTIDAEGSVLREPDYTRLAERSEMPTYPHSSILFSRKAFDAIGGYRAETARWEDVDLSRRMASEGAILVIPEPLVSCRLSGSSSRLNANRLEVVRAMDSMYRHVRCMDASVRGRLLPESFVPTAALEVWQLRRPGVLRWLLRWGALRPDLVSARVLVWSLWADTNPRSLRLVQRSLLRRRNREARRRLGTVSAVRWAPSIAGGLQISSPAPPE